MASPEQGTNRDALLTIGFSDRASLREAIILARAVRELYTRLWLIEQGRTEDLIFYSRRYRELELESGVRLQKGVNVYEEESRGTLELLIPGRNNPKILEATIVGIRGMTEKPDTS